MLVGQVEFRRELLWRIGAVGFAGAGAVARTWGDFDNTQAEPGGLRPSVRSRQAKPHQLALRLCVGDNSKASYVSLGEAF